MSSHHAHRHNSSLSRAIRAQTGMAAFPYMEYSPVNYDAQYNAYGGAYGAYSYGRSPVNPPGAGDTIVTTGTFGPSQEVKDWIYGDNAPTTDDEGGSGSDEEEDTGDETSPDEEEGEGDGSESKSARRRRKRRRLRARTRRRSRNRRAYGDAAAAAAAPAAAAAGGGIDPVSAGISALASLLGIGLKTAVTAGQAKRMQEAEHAAQEQRLRLELASNERSLAAQYAASANAAVGGHGKTILISLGVLGLLGGGLYFVLRKKKK